MFSDNSKAKINYPAAPLPEKKHKPINTTTFVFVGEMKKNEELNEC